MNILLVYPELPDTFFGYRRVLKFIGKKAVSPPLGLLTVAALLPVDWHKRLVDENVETLTDNDIGWADIVFISGMIVQRHSAGRVIDRCNAAGVPVAAGGPLFTIEHEKYPGVDYCILNEAELTLPAFLADFAEGRPHRVYATKQFADLRQSPVPLWELVDLNAYALMDIQCSRGCPYDCEFCYATAFLGHTHRRKSTSQIIAELDSLHAFGWRGEVFFIDDNFIASPVPLKRGLLPALIYWQSQHGPMPFHIQACINLADDDELLSMLVSAGVVQVFIGIETLDETTLAHTGKQQNKNRNALDDIRTIQQAGLTVMGGFVVGFDTDSPAVFQSIIDFIDQSSIVLVIVSILVAPPGTRLHARLLREGRLLDDALCDGSDGSTNIVPRMDADCLREGYSHVLSTIYAPSVYYRRIRAYLSSYPLPRIAAPVTPRALMGVLPVLLHLGMLDSGRFHFWHLLFWCLFRMPRRLPMAVMFTVCGYHYRLRTARYFSASEKTNAN